MSKIKTIFIKLDMNGKSTVTIEDLTSATTIKEFKQKFLDKEGGSVAGVRLIYAGKELSKLDATLSDYNVQNESTFFGVLRLLGGAEAPPGKVYSFDKQKVEKLKLIKIADQTVNITVKKGYCKICMDHDLQLATLHDNHSICAVCMANHARVAVYNGHAAITCPISCQKEIPPIVAFTVAGLNDDEWKEWEMQINKNALCFKSCPNNKCGQFIIKEDKGMRVLCPKCKAYDFCWCLDKWRSSSNLECGNPSCTVIAEALRELEESWHARSSHGKEISKMVNVPLVRVCPNPQCSRLNQYEDKCKHITCDGKTGCHHQYCHACLNKWKGCKCTYCEYKGNQLKTCVSSSYDPCKVAPLQTFF